MNKIIVLIVVVVILLGGVWYASKKSPEPVSEGPIKIGGLFAQTGYAAFAGEASRDGFLMAIEDSGIQIDYGVEDFGSDPKAAVTAAKKLIDVDGAQVIIGPEWAEFGEVVLPLAEETKTLLVSPWMVSESEWARSPYYLSATPSERTRHRKLIDYAVNQGIKNVAIVYSNNAWSLNNVEIFKSEATRNGSLRILGEFKFNPDATDFRTQILQLKALKPDAIYSVIATDEGHGIFSQQLKELNIVLPVLIDNSRAESPVLRDRFLPQVVGQIYPAPKEYKNAAAFNLKYKERFGYSPSALSAATAYDATTLVLRAIKEGAKTADDVRVYLLGVKDYEGYSSTITFNERGQVATEEVVIKQITPDGYQVLVN